MERLKTALEQLDVAIDGLYEAHSLRNKELDNIIEQRAVKRVRAASETAERAVKQAQQREASAVAKASKQQELTGMVANKLDQAIVRLERIIGE